MFPDMFILPRCKPCMENMEMIDALTYRCPKCNHIKKIADPKAWMRNAHHKEAI